MTPRASRCSCDGRFDSVRSVGNLSALRTAIDDGARADDDAGGVAVAAPPATTGIGHTRWATHGRVTEANAHPHYDTDDRVHVVVNGIVENYMELKQELQAAGAVFTSETDAEVIAHLISRHLDEGDQLVDAVLRAYNRLRGHYAFVAVAADEADLLVGARKECPLIVGRGENEQFIASAIPAFLAHTRRVQLIENDEIVVVRRDGVEFLTAAGETVERAIDEVDWSEEVAEKGGYETFMLKEIYEQADAVAETIADRTVRPDGVDLDGLGTIDDAFLRDCNRIVIVACGTSYHAGLIGRYALEQWARVPVEMDIASEYRYRDPVVGPGDLVIGITQSGETADTLAAMRLAKERGAKVMAVTNIMGSQATRDAHGVLYTRAGLEVGVAATKTFVAQVAAMYLLALRLAELRGTLAARAPVRARRRAQAHPALHRHDARERPHGGDRPHRRAPPPRGVLPLPRPPRRPAGVPRGRAQAQGDLLHRHRRLRGRRDEARPDRAAEREDAGRRRGHRLAGAREGRLEHAGGAGPRRARDRRRDRGRRRHRRARRGGPADPARPTGCSSRILAVIPLQLLAYRIARLRGLNVDQPRNLAKTVTVE